MICGIDEAGRGPIIGDLVIVGVTIKKEKEIELKKLGVKDSKLISPKKREVLYNLIIDLVDDYKIISIPPSEIDDALNSSDLNLNWLEAQKSILIINKLKPKIAYVDCPSTNVTKYTEYLKSRINHKKIKLIVEHKADFKYLIVGAASIIAKVTRDRSIRDIEQKIGQKIGSGYPSDPLTKEFLKKNYNKNDTIFRKTWSSYKRIVENKKQMSLNSF